jgi:hypothetical protein
VIIFSRRIEVVRSRETLVNLDLGRTRMAFPTPPTVRIVKFKRLFVNYIVCTKLCAATNTKSAWIRISPTASFSRYGAVIFDPVRAITVALVSSCSLRLYRDVNPIFEGNQQHDAHELLVCLLDIIREACELTYQQKNVTIEASTESSCPAPAKSSTVKTITNKLTKPFRKARWRGNSSGK